RRMAQHALSTVSDVLWNTFLLKVLGRRVQKTEIRFRLISSDSYLVALAYHKYRQIKKIALVVEGRKPALSVDLPATTIRAQGPISS
ncbi:MAG: hypothetical protein ACYTEW_24565, partial [Planctomycetota bacterium]